MHPIDEAFEEIEKEYNEYKAFKMKEFADLGTVIDPGTWDPHFRRVFMMGKLQQLSKGEQKNVTKKAKPKATGRKKSTKSGAKRSDSGQLSLGL